MKGLEIAKECKPILNISAKATLKLDYANKNLE